MLRSALKAILRRTFLGEIVRQYRDYRRMKPCLHWLMSDMRPYLEWLHAGKPAPPPPVVKQMVVKEYANLLGTRVFVETGTYRGDMVHAVKDHFGRIYSMELDPDLFARARTRFAHQGHVSILQGDSSELMPIILAQVQEPCLFWLDAHYSGGDTARGKTNTPILQEVKHVLSHGIRGHVILIDDARHFTGRNGYPTTRELCRLMRARRPDHVLQVKHDIIRSHKNVELQEANVEWPHRRS